MKNFCISLLVSLFIPFSNELNVTDIKSNQFDVEKTQIEEWILVSDNVEGTVYNAVKEQCDGTPMYTASMFRLNLDDVYSHRIIAMERTFMKELGLKYGDIVKVEGTGKFDGVWQIQDTMNKKFAGRKKIDFLVPSDIKFGKWNNLKLYCLNNKQNKDIYLSKMAPQIKKIN